MNEKLINTSLNKLLNITFSFCSIPIAADFRKKLMSKTKT